MAQQRSPAMEYGAIDLHKKESQIRIDISNDGKRAGSSGTAVATRPASAVDFSVSAMPNMSTVIGRRAKNLHDFQLHRIAVHERQRRIRGGETGATGPCRSLP